MSEATAEDRLSEAESRHEALAKQVRLLERRAYLTPEEQRTVAELKKQKLAAKDEVHALRRA
ncbi:MAG: DUF465 domain-containing protein [Sorangiineae bacterium]|nr:DUF465 domain-containing protein [Polyangiaceae bacterium]MEB2323442.1 DUF465 domain-containing protein [Sorangiineae bacterium]